MSKVRLVLVTPDSLLGEALRAVLAPHPEFELLALVPHEQAATSILRKTLSQEPVLVDEPLAVLHWLTEDAAAEPALMRLMIEFPEIIVYQIGPQSLKRYRLCIEARTFPGALESLIEELRSLASDPLPALHVVPRGGQELDR